MRSTIFLGLAACSMLCGCAGSSSSVHFAPNVVFSVNVTSIFKDVKTYNNGVITVGLNQLTGTSTINGASATVEVLANVNYTNGSGRFYGFVTITLADSSALTVTANGTASLNAATGVTTFNASLGNVGGSGQYANTTATGSFTGSRSTALGGAVQMDVQLQVN